MFFKLIYVLAGVASPGTVSNAGDSVTLSSDVQTGAISQDFAGGDVLPISLFLQQDAHAALFGGELALEVASSDLRVYSVTFNPVFSAALGGASAGLPARSFSATRTQPPRSVNRSLGTDRAPVHFATVELEVLSGQPFESALVVKARGALVGRPPESTTVLGNPSRSDGWAEGRIEIVNTRPLDASYATPMQPQAVDRMPWTIQQAAASLEVRPVGSAVPVTVLAPHTEYQIHYSVPGSRDPVPTVNGFDLFVGVGSADAEMPAFQLCWEGADIVDLPSDAAEGNGQRLVVSADLGVDAADSGPLCHFVTGAQSASYRFDLRLYNADPQMYTVVEMVTTAELTVE